MLLYVLACAAYTHPVTGLSSAQSAAAELGLREHHPPPMPEWMAGQRTIWVKTTEGACVPFEGGRPVEGFDEVGTLTTCAR